MHSALNKLLAISSEAIGSSLGERPQVQPYLGHWKSLGGELQEILSGRNGFWTYESSLLVRPFSHDSPPLGLVEWNENRLWKGTYKDCLAHLLFFAEDAFGFQYCFANDRVNLFNPETGQYEELANSLEEWASTIMQDYEYRTGYPLAHSWQMQNNALLPGTRLLPKVPFVLGGKYEVDNLYAVDEVQAMVFRASISNQIRDLPDGSQIVLEVVNKTNQ